MVRFLKKYSIMLSFVGMLISSVFAVSSLVTKTNMKIEALECKDREIAEDIKERTASINNVDRKLSNIEGKLDMIIKGMSNGK